MNRVLTTLFCLFSIGFTPLNAQDLATILENNRWSAYDNFAIIAFLSNQQAEIEYAYCAHCKTNKDTTNWSLKNDILIIGKDTLNVSASSTKEIITSRQNQVIKLQNLNNIKKTKVKKAAIQQFLTKSTSLKIRDLTSTANEKNSALVEFHDNGKMWINNPKYKGQWAIKSFYGDLFLIYLHRNTINRKFPLLKIKRFKKGKLIGVPIPLSHAASTTLIEISK